MLHEFHNTVNVLKKMMKKLIDISQGKQPDDIDLSELYSDGASLSAMAFEKTGAFVPAAKIAQREAYDVVSSNSRLVVTYARNRAYYYKAAKVDYTADHNYISAQDATLQKLAKYGENRK